MERTIPRPGHPSPDRVRPRWLNLNGEWDFSFDTPVYDRRITVPYSWTSPLSGVADERKGIAYYRKTLRYDAGDDRLFLIFGAVDYTAKVTVNGLPVGEHVGGYARFELEVTDAWDSYADNVIELCATDNDEPYQTYGKQGYGNARGIWQTVWLESRPRVYLDSYRIRTALDGTVTVSYTAAGGDDPGLIARFDGKEYRGEDGSLTFRLENPRLWTPSDPYLYRGELILGADTVETYFGVREIGAGKPEGSDVPRILLNGEPIFLSGVLDQSFHPSGFFTLPTDEECEEEILRMKRLGLNLARIHIKTEDPLKLYYADLHGLLIMQDIPCFWGDPTETAMRLFEEQMKEVMLRDINHPAIIYWVVFNETWGLFTRGEDGKKQYLPETQEWVRRMYRLAKELDPTRLVEDNSPCNHDHVETDVLTWHFYRNGYRSVKAEIDRFCLAAEPGAGEEYIGDNVNGDVPAMNSECGNVWGIVNGGAGDSDLSWQYHYMMNEFRLHDRLSGFVFTEFHDVLNEFNGYYRIDSTKKLFGYEGHVPGMSLLDLHGPLFLATDCPPMVKRKPGEELEVPLVLSCFDGAHVGRMLNLRWETVLTDRNGTETAVEKGASVFRCRGYGASPIGTRRFRIPEASGILTLRLYLTEVDGTVLMRNFLLCDIDRPAPDALSIPVSAASTSGFRSTATRIADAKLTCTGSGSATYLVKKADIPGYTGGEIHITFEACPKEELTRDLPDGVSLGQDGELGLMLGDKVDRGANPNCFYMTDETLFPGTVTVSAEGNELAAFRLPDTPADSRGCLSHLYQPADDMLEDAGSYGYLCRATVPADLAAALPDTFRLTFTADEGLALFGRSSGRYPCGIDITAL